MPDLHNQYEIDAYYLSDRAQPRAAGVMWAALVERRLDRLFEVALRPNKKVYNELLLPGGPLGNYAVKARLCYMLGWVGTDVYADLITISKIRNRFAHVIEAKDFSDKLIATWLKSMIVHKFLPNLLEDAKRKLESARTAINMAMVDIYQDAMEDGQLGFRMCIDLIIDYVEKCRTNMSRNLERLPDNWLVANPDEGKKANKGEPS